MIYKGEAIANTGSPVMWAAILFNGASVPEDGVFKGARQIGDMVKKGEIVAFVNNNPLRSQIDGVLRGLLHDGLKVRKGMKAGDVDPRACRDHCFTISDKARAIAGGVLESILYLWRCSCCSY